MPQHSLENKYEKTLANYNLRKGLRFLFTL